MHNLIDSLNVGFSRVFLFVFVIIASSSIASASSFPEPNDFFTGALAQTLQAGNELSHLSVDTREVVQASGEDQKLVIDYITQQFPKAENTKLHTVMFSQQDQDKTTYWICLGWQQNMSELEQHMNASADKKHWYASENVVGGCRNRNDQSPHSQLYQPSRSVVAIPLATIPSGDLDLRTRHYINSKIIMKTPAVETLLKCQAGGYGGASGPNHILSLKKVDATYIFDYGARDSSLSTSATPDYPLNFPGGVDLGYLNNIESQLQWFNQMNGNIRLIFSEHRCKKEKLKEGVFFIECGMTMTPDHLNKGLVKAKVQMFSREQTSLYASVDGPPLPLHIQTMQATITLEADNGLLLKHQVDFDNVPDAGRADCSARNI